MRNPDDQPTAKDGLPRPSGGNGDTIQVGSLSALSNLQGVLTPPGLVLPGISADDSPPVSPPGKKYQIVAEIGKGGMGTVYKTFDADLRRWVAMKLVRGEAAGSKDYLARFIEEAQVTGQLEHPGILPVHELGVDAQGRVYFTMKLVKGRTLQEIARDLALGRREGRREFTPIRLAQLLQQAAMGSPTRTCEGRDPPRPEAGQHHGRRLRRGARSWTGAWRRCSGRRRARPTSSERTPW